MANNEGMRQIIETVNKLQDAFAMSGITLGSFDLPQIAVVGGQSSGKSSVLENIVGRDFLPRGNGIVTRRPLCLQMHYNKEEYAVFNHKENEKYTDFNEVRKEIERETEKVAGSRKGVSNVPIILNIYSPNVLDLTLVDLPGITKIPVGDQPADIENQIRDMILPVIQKESTLILAVSAANVDLALSDALKLSKEVDPEGTRTIGVVTKLDLMDEGTDARAVLENRIFPLQRGYVGLVNRSQRDIETQKDICAAQKAEKEFFTNHPSYRHLAHRCGAKFLQSLLNQQLYEHIRDKLPQLRSMLNYQYQRTRQELEEMKALHDETPNDSWRQKLFIKLYSDFADDLKHSIEGENVNVDILELSPGSKINMCFYNTIMKILKTERGISQEELVVILKNLHCIRNALFTPELAIDICVKKIVTQYKAPMMICVNLIAEILVNAVNKSARIFHVYPKFKDEVLNLVNDKIKSFEEETKEHLNVHIDAQVSFINTKHPDFHRVVSPEQIPDSFKREFYSSELESDDPEFSNIAERASSMETVAMTTDSYGSDNTSVTGGSETVQPSAELDKKFQILHKGWMSLFMPNGVIRKSRNFWFVLNAVSLAWYKDQKERTLVGSFPLEYTRIMRDKTITNRLILFKENSPTPKLLVLNVRDNDDEQQWIQNFQKAGVPLQERQEQNLPNANNPNEVWEEYDEQTNKAIKAPTGPMKLEPEPELNGEIDMILYMISSYMAIMHKTIKDLVPKYIVLLLIKSTLNYVSKSLLADLMDKDDWGSLLESSAEEQRRKKQLFQIYEATQKGIGIINDVAQTAVTKDEDLVQSKSSSMISLSDS